MASQEGPSAAPGLHDRLDPFEDLQPVESLLEQSSLRASQSVRSAILKTGSTRFWRVFFLGLCTHHLLIAEIKRLGIGKGGVSLAVFNLEEFA